jgi:hypothetical protein
LNRRLTALVIGNSAYPGDDYVLKNPVNDADDISKALIEIGFNVTTLKDASEDSINDAVNSFRDNLNSSDVGLFYFAGHGVEIQGVNYITAIDTIFQSEASLKFSAYSLDLLMAEMADCTNHTNLIILDACRNNPFSRTRSGRAANSLAPMFAPKGTFIAYSTSPGQTSKDGNGRNGAYTDSLLRHLHTPDLSIEEIFKRTRNSLASITGGKQTSWEHTSLTNEFVFNVSIFKSMPSSLYSKDALIDKDFALPQGNETAAVIRSLKTHNWYVQNPAMQKIDTQLISNATKDELFVLGRNIYQAAVGGEQLANQFIEDFRTKTAGLDANKTKQLLDGILFEIFFDSHGNLRENYKFSKFNIVFELQQYPEFNDSFSFIANTLAKYPTKFYQFPGAQRPVSLDINIHQNSDGENVIDRINLYGTNILKLQGGISQDSWNADPTYYPTSLRRLTQTLSEELVIPLRLIQINLLPEPETNKTRFLYPSYHTLTK